MGESGRMRWRNEDFLGAALHDQISKPMDAMNMFKVDQIQTLLVTQHMMFVCLFCFFFRIFYCFRALPNRFFDT